MVPLPLRKIYFYIFEFFDVTAQDGWVLGSEEEVLFHPFSIFFFLCDLCGVFSKVLKKSALYRTHNLGGVGEAGLVDMTKVKFTL